MKIRHVIFSAAALAGLAFATSSYADTIAYVNVQEIMRESSAAKSMKDQLAAKYKVFQAEMSKKEEELQKEDQALAKQHGVLSSDAFEKKAKDFRAKATAVQKEAQTKRQELDNASSSALNEIQKATFEIVSKIAKDKGYTAVLSSSELLYADAKDDITKEVLSKLNSSLPKVTVKFQAVKDTE